MWRFFQDNLNNNTQVDLKNSIYCGDAAGRVEGKKKDFSDSDLYLLTNEFQKICHKYWPNFQNS